MDSLSFSSPYSQVEQKHQQKNITKKNSSAIYSFHLIKNNN